MGSRIEELYSTDGIHTLVSHLDDNVLLRSYNRERIRAALTECLDVAVENKDLNRISLMFDLFTDDNTVKPAFAKALTMLASSFAEAGRAQDMYDTYSLLCDMRKLDAAEARTFRELTNLLVDDHLHHINIYSGDMLNIPIHTGKAINYLLKIDSNTAKIIDRLDSHFATVVANAVIEDIERIKVAYLNLCNRVIEEPGFSAAKLSKSDSAILELAGKILSRCEETEVAQNTSEHALIHSAADTYVKYKKIVPRNAALYLARYAIILSAYEDSIDWLSSAHIPAREAITILDDGLSHHLASYQQLPLGNSAWRYIADTQGAIRLYESTRKHFSEVFDAKPEILPQSWKNLLSNVETQLLKTKEYNIEYVTLYNLFHDKFSSATKTKLYNHFINMGDNYLRHRSGVRSAKEAYKYALLWHNPHDMREKICDTILDSDWEDMSVAERHTLKKLAKEIGVRMR